MIDEKKLIDRIRHDIECAEADMMKDHDLYVRVADMIHMIEGQPKINRWIPVEEKLPEEGAEVIVTVDGGGRIDAFVSSDVFAARDWQNWDGVIAWMPLPEPFNPQN